MMRQKLLTIKEVAEMLGISETTMRNPKFRQRVGLTVVRVGRQVRFSPSELENFIARNAESISPSNDAS